MANAKYDNLTVLMTTGWFNWAGDAIVAILMTDVEFDTTDVTVEDVGGSRLQVVPITGRSVAPDGALLGRAVSFNNMPKDIEFQMLIAKDMGPGTLHQLIAFYDTGEDGPLTLKNNGTLIVRPEAVQPTEDTGAGVWVKI
jgi:hypothetical protein